MRGWASILQFFSQDHLSSIQSILLGGTLPFLLLSRTGWQDVQGRKMAKDLVAVIWETENLQQTLGSPNKFVSGAAKSEEETRPKPYHLHTGFFWVKPNPRNEPRLDPGVCTVCTERKQTGRLPIHILLSVLGFGRSINFLYVFCSKFPTTDVFTWFPKTAPSVWFYLQRTSKTCRPWKLISLFWLFLGGISIVGFGMGVCNCTKYQVKLAYYESASFTHNFFFYFFFF